MLSKFVIPKLSRKAIPSRMPIGPRRATPIARSWPTGWKPPRPAPASRRAAGSDSGRKITISARAMKDMPAATKKGSDSEDTASGPAIPGPSTMPTPIAAPITPIPPPRSSSEVLSLMKAIAVGSVAEDRMPARARAMNSMGRVVASPKMIWVKALPSTPTIRIGLRP